MLGRDLPTTGRSAPLCVIKDFKRQVRAAHRRVARLNPPESNIYYKGSVPVGPRKNNVQYFASTLEENDLEDYLH